MSYLDSAPNILWDQLKQLAQLYIAVDGTITRLEERMWNAHLSSSVQGQNDGAGQVRAA